MDYSNRDQYHQYVLKVFNEVSTIFIKCRAKNNYIDVIEFIKESAKVILEFYKKNYVYSKHYIFPKECVEELKYDETSILDEYSDIFMNEESMSHSDVDECTIRIVLKNYTEVLINEYLKPIVPEAPPAPKVGKYGA